MLSPVFTSCENDAGVQAELGDPPRIYAFGTAPDDAVPPYLIWFTVSGAPENVLAGTPDYDGYRVQLTAYGAQQNDAVNAARAVRNCLEQVADVVSWNGEGRDPATKEFTYSFDVSFLPLR